MLINSSSIVKYFEICDYIPFASTISNIGCLVLKNRISYAFDEHFYYYLQEKAKNRSIILLFPGIGNLSIALYDFVNRKFSCPEYMLSMIRKDHQAFKNASLSLRTDLSFLLNAIKESHEVLRYFDKNMLRNPHFMFHALKRNAKAIDYVGSSIRHPESITRLTEYIIRSLGRFYYEESVDKVLKDFSINKCVVKVLSKKVFENSLVKIDEKNKTSDGVMLFNSLPKEILETIFYYLRAEDLDCFSRTVTLFQSNTIYVKKIKDPLIKEITLIVTFLIKISLDKRFQNHNSSISAVISNLQKMIDSNLKQGFSTVTQQFSKIIDSNFVNATRTRVLLNLRKLDSIATRLQIINDFEGNQFLSDVFNSVPHYIHYKHIQ